MDKSFVYIKLDFRKLLCGGQRIGTDVIGAHFNVDDPYGCRLADDHTEETTLTFGTSKRAQLRATDVELAPDGTTFTLDFEGKRYLVQSPLIGHYNVSNTLAALSIAALAGVSVEQSIGSLNSFSGIPGRMERIDCGQLFEVVVDYAHTGNALDNALKMLSEITPGKVKVVFGEEKELVAIFPKIVPVFDPTIFTRRPT